MTDEIDGVSRGAQGELVPRMEVGRKAGRVEVGVLRTDCLGCI